MFWRGNIEGRLCLQAIIFLHQRVTLKFVWRDYQYTSIERWKRKNFLIDFSSCFDTDEMLPISSHFKLFSRTWQKILHKGSKDVS